MQGRGELPTKSSVGRRCCHLRPQHTSIRSGKMRPHNAHRHPASPSAALGCDGRAPECAVRVRLAGVRRSCRTCVRAAQALVCRSRGTQDTLTPSSVAKMPPRAADRGALARSRGASFQQLGAGAQCSQDELIHGAALLPPSRRSLYTTATTTCVSFRRPWV